MANLMDAVMVGPSELVLYSSNAAVNRMKKDEIVEELRKLNLNPRGNKEEVSKRLKTYWKRRRALDKAAAQSSSKPIDRFYDYLCVIDFECTCEGRDNNVAYPHEIIEFPVVLLRTTTCEVVDEFHSYCKPVINPVLSTFCTELTGITQEQVNDAPSFPEVLAKFTELLEKHELGTKNRFAFVTDGPADFGTFLQLQFQQINSPLPHWMRSWINIRRTFCRVYKKERTSLAKMLEEFGMEFSGRQHSGLDDARNIARIVAHMLEDGHELRVNERLLRRDRLEASGKAVSPMRDSSEAKEAKESEEEGDEEENAVFAMGPSSEGTRKKAMQAASAAVPRRYRILPYKVLVVSKEEFMRNAYEECLTCDERESGDDS